MNELISPKVLDETANVEELFKLFRPGEFLSYESFKSMLLMYKADIKTQLPQFTESDIVKIYESWGDLRDFFSNGNTSNLLATIKFELLKNNQQNIR